MAKDGSIPHAICRGSTCSEARRGPGVSDSWIQRKLALFIVFGLAIWSFYVVVGRACTPMIRKQSASGMGNRAVGAGVLSGFLVLWFLFVWSYIKMIITPPGYAVNHVGKSPAPDPTDYPRPQPSNFLIRDHDEGPDPSTLAPTMNLANEAVDHWYTNTSTTAPFMNPLGTSEAAANPKRGVRDWRDIERPVPYVDFVPKWCQYCGILKPERTHHCRHCGACVLQFDHHCLWVGQCVGWANHKFFIIFNMWTGIYCLYITIFLAVTVSRATSLDGQMVGLIAVSALFGLFSITMLLTHIQLILSGRTTVESFASRDQHERENTILQKEFGVFWHNMEKKRIKKRWEKQWGNSRVDERWKFGTKMQMWREEMGESPLGWFIPIGTPLGNGIHYKSNAKFGPHGEWLMKKDWPSELQV